MMLTFKNETHEYFYGGIKIPSVTTVLKDVGIINTDFLVETGAERGIDVHLATQYLDEGCLEEESIKPDYRNYVNAYKRFIKEINPKWELKEQQVCDLTLGYAGTFDRFGYMLGSNCMVDIKTGAPHKWHGAQLFAYSHAKNPLEKMRRFGLYLNKNGTYKLLEYTNPRDFEVFKAALLCYKFKRS